IARINNKIIINPNLYKIKKSDINLIIGGSYHTIVMIEGDMKEISNRMLIKIIKYAHNFIKIQIRDQIDFYKKTQKYKSIKKKRFKYYKNNKLKKIIKKKFYKKIFDIIKSNKKKKDRNYKLNKIYLKIKNKFNNIFLIKNEFLIYIYYNYYKKNIIKKNLFEKKIRLDGRYPTQIRNIWGKINYLPGVHGSILFTRGETQSLTTVTLGTSLDVNKIDNVVLEYIENFYLHYNFPPFSTGEVKNIRGISRREIGHGNLAKKALKYMIPLNNPYTIRIVSDILESNGSSSMATVCAGTLALMDAGIKIKRPVAGLAIGLMKNKKKIIILSDILGEEDYYGDMDFKITRTKKGITSCQMDIKNKNINFLKSNILNNILKISKISINKILKIMNNILYLPRLNLKDTAPKFYFIKIPNKYIGLIIGQGGKNIQFIENYTNTNIIITSNNNIARIEIFGKKQVDINKAINIIKKIIKLPKKGNIYKAIIKNIKNNKILVKISKLEKIYLNIYNNKNYKKGQIINIKYKGK
ncbi:MAG: polyribonucleotide nucleotidyltransferase, partial [Candidatus Shikimatogenerans sp. JK-2022]|nr:polyribonucleotide nucleotidyltransferase [Candidatus Shikimatogenerans bostrichidophilus]